MKPEKLPLGAGTSLLADVDISGQLTSRRIGKLNRKGELSAMYDLAGAFSQNSSLVLKHLSNLAIELCHAGSAGVSVIESSDAGEVFRWRALTGELARFVGGSTPRDWSPCGECLKAGRATLYSYPARYFTYFQELDLPIVEGLVIPMFWDDSAVGTIWVVSHVPTHPFDAEHVRIMTSLGTFASTALRSQATELTGEARGARDIVWQEFVRRVLQRDELALEALFEETYSLVFATALRIVSFSADAEDVVADVYTRVWMKTTTFNAHRGSVSSWLVGMARNGAIDKLRARGVRGRSEAALLDQCGGGETPETTLDAAERLEILKRSLAGLPVEQRRAIELFYFSELSAAEIAAELRQSIGTVKTRLRLGRLRLRCQLAALEPSRSRGPCVRKLCSKASAVDISAHLTGAPASGD